MSADVLKCYSNEKKKKKKKNRSIGQSFIKMKAENDRMQEGKKINDH